MALRPVNTGILANIFSAAPKVSLYHVFLTHSPERIISRPSQCPVEQLQLWDCDSRQAVIKHIELPNLRRFESTHHHYGIIACASNTLEHICFQKPSVSSIPPLNSIPRLRSVDLVLDSGSISASDGQDLLSMLSTICRSCPETLQEIIVTIKPFNSTHSLEATVLASLDILVVECRTSPVLQWRLSFTLDDSNMQPAHEVARFTEFIQAGLPNLSQSNQLVVERY
ncbi:hypothetical protein DFH06DRAFT_57902 [Mycena polygramma]|nr:hypothetical protein DFH06DRAFT_57902 [Mycena polygramma]